MIWSKSYSVQV